jgi:hypothetical protein
MDKATKMEYVRRLFYAMILPIEEILNKATQAGDLKVLPDNFSAAALLVGMVNGQIQFYHAAEKGALGIKEVKYIVDIFWDGMCIEESA